MAKKVKKKLEEDEEARSFTFPEFDVPGFLKHEFEQSAATLIAVLLSVVLALVCFGLDRTILPVVVPLGVGIALIVASPFVIMRLRPDTSGYTKGDWAGLIVTELFGWLGVWFLLLNLIPT